MKGLSLSLILLLPAGAAWSQTSVSTAPAPSPMSAEEQRQLQQQVQDLQQRLSRVESPGTSADNTSFPAQTQTKSPPFTLDYSWLNGNSRETAAPFDSKYFTGELLIDTNYVYDFNHPSDHTIDGSCETGRAEEVQVQQFGVGGDLHMDNVRGRIMTQFGMYSQMTPRNDSSPSRGQWNLGQAYQYVSEAYGGYHFDVMHGVNVDAGIFMSYIGLFSYYNAENWAYQPSYVSANTPWFFNGIRIQTFPTDTYKSEFWIINGWQSYGMFNSEPGLGTEQLWRPNGIVSLVSNDYWGQNTLGNSVQGRVHTDNSLEVKYYDNPKKVMDKAAFSLTLDAGCQQGGGANCALDGSQASSFVGFMLYNRNWFDNDHYGLTIGGGAVDNPGRYLVLLPPINGATASSGTPYYTENPGDSFKAWDFSVTFDYMPDQFITWRLEFDHRAANQPYFVGPDGITPPGGNTGAPGSTVPGWTPDLVKDENRINASILIRI